MDLTSVLQDSQCDLSSLMPVLRQYLTAAEEAQIIKQFRCEWRRNAQVLWSGILLTEAQEWADKHHMQTLTTAMGFLMDKKNPMCPNYKRKGTDWVRYINGASAVFAWLISQGESVILLSPPPPQRFSPNGFTSLQMIEIPILRWAVTLGHTALQIQIVHPMVQGAEDFHYQIWPVDETNTWYVHFKTAKYKQRPWKLRGWDSWRVLFTSTIDSMVGSGFWSGSEIFGMSDWRQVPVRIKKRKSCRKKSNKLKNEALKVEEDSKLQKVESHKISRKKKKKVNKEMNKGEDPSHQQELKNCTVKKRKKRKKKRKEGCNGTTETKEEKKAKVKKEVKK